MTSATAAPAVRRRVAIAISLLAWSVTPACDDAEPTKAEAADVADTPDAAKAAPKDPGEGKPAAAAEGNARDATDKGTASLKLGDAPWEAERSSARLEGTRLSISASHLSMEDGKANRQALSLVIAEYAGPGAYKAAMGSSFVGVGLDIDAAKAADGDDAKTTEVAKKALTGAEIVMLTNADVKITAATDDRIEGSVSWTAPPGTKGPASLQGEFTSIMKP